MSLRVRAGGAALTLVLVCVIACAPSHGAEFPRAMRDADLAAEHGDRAGAARGFEHAAEVALLARDRDDARHAAARMWARAGDVPRALAELDALAGEVPPGPEAGSAFYDAAWLRVGSGDAERGFRDLAQVVRRFPNDGDARPALHHLLDHLDETEGPAAALAWLRRLAPELDRTGRAEEIAYEIAVRIERTGALREAHDDFLAVASRWPYPEGALWDDALAHASAVAERLGDPALAAGDLRAMLGRREHALLVGSAERSRYAVAQLHLGELYRDKLADPVRAREAFHALFDAFPDSPIRDRGLFEEASVLRSEGDVHAACDRLEELVRTVPDSRYAPCARLTCPGLRAHPAATAPTECHAYISEPRPGTSAR